MNLKHKFNCYKIFEKGSWIVLLPFFIAACSQTDLSKSGRLSFHNTGGTGSFIFTVSDNFVQDHKNSPQSEYNPKITKAESDLLEKLLKQSGYCNNDKNPPYIITSKQEKIYDMTFAHLIEENYNARPIVPRTYFGQCRVK